MFIICNRLSMLTKMCILLNKAKKFLSTSYWYFTPEFAFDGVFFKYIPN